MNDPVAGDRLGDRYHLVDRRAAGATATVWAAHDELLDRRVAVKVLHPHLADDELAARFADEARTSATVTHPGLVAVYDTLAGPPPAIVLEWVDGGDLRTRLDAGPLDPDSTANLGAALADALAALHSRGLVHRDVKPANVLLTPDGRPKLADFGIATTTPGDRTATGIVLGTAKYLSPEQVRGEPIDGRTDIYSLCAVLYEAATGRPPFERDGDLPTAIARLEETPVAPRSLRPEISPRLEAAVLRGLVREPEARWRTAHELRDELYRLREIATSDFAPSPISSREISPSEVDLTRAAPPPVAARTSPPGPDDAHPVPDRTVATTRAGTAGTAAKTAVRPRRRRWPRLVGLTLLVAVGVLGWQLVTSGGTVGTVLDGLAPGDPVVVGVTTFDPEGSGPAGEHDDLVDNVLDDDPETVWFTERYEQRDLGTKAGVGLVFELEERVRVDTVEIHTVGGSGWEASVHVADEVGDDLSSFGFPDADGEDLPASAVLEPGARGRHVLVWFVDLGRGELPIRLVVDRIVVR